MKVELFLADCKLCQRMETIMRELFPHIDLEIHRASECVDGSCCARASEVGVKAVPALALDGKVAQTGLPTDEELERLKQILSP